MPPRRRTAALATPLQHHNTPCTFYIKLKTSKCRPAVKKDTICTIIDKAVQSFSAQEDIVESILQEFDAIEPVVKEVVKLDKGHYLPNKSDDEPAAAPKRRATGHEVKQEEEEEAKENQEVEQQQEENQKVEQQQEEKQE